MTAARPRMAVVGVGHVGRHHARILADLVAADLVTVVDTVPSRAEAVAAETGARAETDFRRLFGQVEAVTVAVPTETHADVVCPLLEQGIAVLVEKPMSGSVAEADRMVAAAAATATILAVGHTERHNPAVTTVLPLVTTPHFIEVHRLASFAPRSLDVDVVFDLMIHDLDVIMTLVRDDVTAIDAVGVPVLSDRVDIANARIRFARGAIANLTASRISRERVRKIRFFQPGAYLSIDYAAQEAEAWRLVRPDGAPPSIVGGKLDVPQDEPLRREIADFVAAVTGGGEASVTGHDGRRAVALAERIRDAMQSGIVGRAG